MRKGRETVLEVAGRKVVITNPDKLFFLQAGYTRLDLARYYAAVAEGPCGMARCRRGMERAHLPFRSKRTESTGRIPAY